MMLPFRWPLHQPFIIAFPLRLTLLLSSFLYQIEFEASHRYKNNTTHNKSLFRPFSLNPTGHQYIIVHVTIRYSDSIQRFLNYILFAPRSRGWHS